MAFRTSWLAAALSSLALILGAGPAPASAQPVFKGAYTSFPDYMDPALSYTAEGWTAMYDTYVPLLTYRHAAGVGGAEVIPGLAEELPRITDGGKTYTLFLRPGLTYSDGTPVRASDFRFTVERLFSVNSGGLIFYRDIVGATAFRSGHHHHITGITANDITGKIVIHLTRPSGTFSNVLALLFVAPVPANTPLEDQTFTPPPATGPYMITSSKPGYGWTYARNPAWRGNGALMPEIPAGDVDHIDVSVVRNRETQVKELKSGRLDWLFDPPPPGRAAEVEAGAGGTQLRVEPTLSTYYFWLNTKRAPFDDLKVRQAVEYAVDPVDLSRIYSGQLLPTDQILPPDMPGYRKFDLYPHSMRKARRLIREAAPKDREVTVWTDSEAPNGEAGVYLRGVLAQLGFHATLRVENPDNYFTEIGNARSPDLDAGFAEWFQDYPHPDDFFAPLLAEKPTRAWNLNFPRLTVPRLNQKVASLAQAPIDEAAYARLDREFMKLAPIVPYGTRTLQASFSRAVGLGGFVWNPTFGADLTSLKFR